VEALKRPSPGVEGQIGVDEVSARGAGSPLSWMPPKTEGGLWPTRSPYKLHAITKATFMMQPYLSLEFPMHMFASKLKE